MAHTILVADDEQEIIDLLRLYLEKEGHAIVEATGGAEALAKLRSERIDLAILDVMMPGMNGFDLLRELRSDLHIPVIFLSAKSQDHDKILGFGLGADDYIAKPFNPLEVAARVNAQLRRYYYFNLPIERESGDELRIGELALRRESASVYRRGQEIALTTTEYKLLCLFMENAGRVLTKLQIFEQLWGEHYVDDNAIVVHICNLRDKIEDDPRRPVYLKTIRGLGYKFEKKVELHEADLVE